jgi:uncharacterized protein YndB with AHSA1/START domain
MLSRSILTILSGFLIMTATFLTGVSLASPDPIEDTTCIDIETVVTAPLTEVWHAWTTCEGAQEFFAPKAEIDLFPGGAYNILFMPDNPPGQRGAEDQKVLSYLPMEMLSFEWGAPPAFPFARAHPGWVVIQFKELDQQHTHVRLVHTGFEELKQRHPEHASEFDQTREYFNQAWPKVLGWLKRRFDDGPRWDEKGNELWVK